MNPKERTVSKVFREAIFKTYPELAHRPFAETIPDLDADLRLAIEIALEKAGPEKERSQKTTPPHRSGLPVGVSVDVASEIVREGRRALALKYHPDKGGDSERMTLCNATADFLEKRLPDMLSAGGSL